MAGPHLPLQELPEAWSVVEGGGLDIGATVGHTHCPARSLTSSLRLAREFGAALRSCGRGRQPLLVRISSLFSTLNELSCPMPSGSPMSPH